MIDLNHRLCENPICDLHPNFGFKGQKARFCYQHKEEGMVDIISKRCENVNCEKHATHGYKGQGYTYCSSHKVEGMINLDSQKCESLDCLVTPLFGIEGEKARFCKKHKANDMVDVKSKRCENEACVVKPSYGRLYSRTLIFCSIHASLNYYNRAKLSPVCQVIDCYETSHFIDPEDSNVYPVRCGTHRLSTNIELIFRLCPNCGQELYFPSDKKICMDCGYYREKKLHNFKESMVKHFLTSNNVPFVHNRPASLNGSKFRPDFLIQSKFGYIVLEVDEHQHKEYIQEEEILRMHTIYNDIQFIRLNSQVLFIRFNPDEYKGVQCELKNRHKYLHNIVTHFIDQEIIGVPLAQLKLFYDRFDETPVIEPLLYFSL